MNKKTASVLAAGVAVPALAAAVLVPALASASTTSHTIKFTAVKLKQANVSKTAFAESEKDVKNGKIIGFDVIRGSFNPTTHSASGNAAVALKGGDIYATLRFSNGPTTTGQVTGGTGKYKGITGTITGQSHAHGRTSVTITYQS